MGSRARFPLLLLLGVVFLASVSVSFGIAYWEQDNPNYDKCLQSCNNEKDLFRLKACNIRCRVVKDPDFEVKEQEKEHHSEHEEKEEEEDQGSKSQKERNPYLFRSNSYHTLFRNQHGYIRILQKFNSRSRKLENLENYRMVEFLSKPNTLLLPHHADADFILVVVEGKAILTLVYPDHRVSYNLERGDAITIKPGTSYYLINRDNNQNLRVIKLAVPVNRPGKFQHFFPSTTEEQPSYFRGFSNNLLEAAFNAKFEEIEKVLLEGEQQQGSKHSQREGVIVDIPKEKVQELSRKAKSSSRKSISSENEPFNLKSGSPTYANKFGKLYEITPEKNPQLKELNVFLSWVQMKEGAVFLPHYNSEGTVILEVNEGEANLQLVALKEVQQKQEEEEEKEEKEEEKEQEKSFEVRRYNAELDKRNVFVIPSSFPVAINASSDFGFIAFGINGENNQRYFLTGEKDNVLKHIDREVRELAFPGSAEEIDKLLKKQKESYFADAQPQHSEEGRNGRKGPISSILNAFY